MTGSIGSLAWGVRLLFAVAVAMILGVVASVALALHDDKANKRDE